MQEMYHIRSTQELEVQELVARFGEKHPTVIAARKRLEIRNEAMKNYRDVLDSKYFIKTRIDGSGSSLVKKDLSVEIAALKRAQGIFARMTSSFASWTTSAPAPTRLSFQRADESAVSKRIAAARS